MDNSRQPFYDDVTELFHFWRNQKIAPQGVIIASQEIQECLSHCMIIIRYLFKALDSLYLVTKNIPDVWSDRTTASIKLGGSYNFIIHLDIKPEDYQTLRTVLALTGDVYSSSNALLSVGKKNLAELRRCIKHLKQDAEYFIYLRNFFTHMDEVFEKPKKHGISGARHIDCGIEYMDTAISCVHLVTIENMVYFTWKSCAIKTDISKSCFDQIFHSARGVYAELFKHIPDHLLSHVQETLRSPEYIYPTS